MENRKNLVELKNNLTLVIQKQAINMKLLQAINTEFINKGLEIEIPSMLFNREIEIELLNEGTELIGLTNAIYNFFKDKDLDKELKVKDYIIDINPSHYFSDAELTSYDLYEKTKEKEYPDIIDFENCIKIDTNTYWVFNKASKFSDLRKHRKIAYFKEIQRATKKEITASGEVIEKINTNKEGIKSLTNRFKAHNIKPTTITLTILQQPKKKPYVKFNTISGNMGTLSIKPVFDRNAEDYAPLIINDGYHRWTGLCDAYDEDNKVKDEGLGTFIIIMNEKEAKQFTADTFEQNATEKKHIETMKDTAENNFIEIVVNNSDILMDNVTSTLKDCKALNKLTYLNALNDCVKYTNIDLEDEITVDREANQIANIIDIMIRYMMSKQFNKNIDEMKQHFFLLKPNMFVGYIAIANILKNEENYKTLTGKIADKLMEVADDLNKKLKLDEECNIEKIEKVYNYFEELAKEVI